MNDKLPFHTARMPPQIAELHTHAATTAAKPQKSSPTSLTMSGLTGVGSNLVRHSCGEANRAVLET